MFSENIYVRLNAEMDFMGENIVQYLVKKHSVKVVAKDYDANI